MKETKNLTTESTEMYLKEIYLLTKNEESAKTGRIAERLDVSPPSVTEKLEELSNAELINYEKYRGANLTDTGEEIAQDLLQKHCLIERFLVKFLDVEEGFHEEACRIEHVMSDDVANQLGDIVEQEPSCPDCYSVEDQHCALLFSS